MRIFTFFLPLALLSVPITANAAPQTKTLEEVLSKSTGQDGLSLKDKLPSAAQMDAIIEQLPDFNHMLDGFMEIAQDEKIRDQIIESADHMKSELETSGALELRENGLPDFNAGIEVMLRSMSDEKGLGGLLDAMEFAGDDIKTLMKESLDKANKP